MQILTQNLSELGGRKNRRMKLVSKPPRVFKTCEYSTCEHPYEPSWQIYFGVRAIGL